MTREKCSKVPLSLDWKQANRLKVKKTRFGGQNRVFGVFWAFRAPHPPIKNLRGLWFIFQLFLAYLDEKIITDMAWPKQSMGSWWPVLPNWKNWNLLKSQFKNITHISDIHFWKFHRFASMVAGWLKPSNVNLRELILDEIITEIFFQPPTSSPGHSTKSPSDAVVASPTRRSRLNMTQSRLL